MDWLQPLRPWHYTIATIAAAGASAWRTPAETFNNDS